MVLSSTDPQDHRKPCTLCSTPRDVLIRCQIDETNIWHFACPQKCWKEVSGGVVDGDSSHPHYRYGGVWKNKVGGVSGKKPKTKGKGKGNGGKGMGKEERKEWREGDKYTRNDRVVWGTKVWICRKSHVAREGEEPGLKVALWKEDAESAGMEEVEAEESEGVNMGVGFASASEILSGAGSGTETGSASD